MLNDKRGVANYRTKEFFLGDLFEVGEAEFREEFLGGLLALGACGVCGMEGGNLLLPIKAYFVVCKVRFQAYWT